MPKIGLSRPYVALYNENGFGTVTYKNGIRAGRAVEYSVEVEAAEDNDFYADDGIAETDSGTFSSGTLSLTTAELEDVVTALILGIKAQEITVGENEVNELVFDDDMEPPYLGFGIIERGKVKGKLRFRAVVLTKIKFSIPSDAATTKGETIEWQTQEISGTILRDDTEKHRWKRSATFDSWDDADAYIRQVLNITDEQLGTLTVNSVAGTASGKTKVTVTPEKGEGNNYQYKLGKDLTAPKTEQEVGTGYESWDGTSEITAADGDKIVVLESDPDNNPKKSGIADVETAD